LLPTNNQVYQPVLTPPDDNGISGDQSCLLCTFVSLTSFEASPNPYSVAPPFIPSNYYYPSTCVAPSFLARNEPDFHLPKHFDGAQVNQPTNFCFITPSPELKSAHLPVYPTAPTEEAPHFSQHATPCFHPEEVKVPHLPIPIPIPNLYLPLSPLGLIDVDIAKQTSSSQTAISTATDAALKNETGIPAASCVLTESAPPPSILPVDAQACGHDQQNGTRRTPVMKSMRSPTVESDDEDPDDDDDDDDDSHDSNSTYWYNSMIKAALIRRVPLLAALSDHLLAISKDPRIMRSDDTSLVALTNELLPDLLKLTKDITSLAVKVSEMDIFEVI
jgi:hypothetical protein